MCQQTTNPNPWGRYRLTLNRPEVGVRVLTGHQIQTPDAWLQADDVYPDRVVVQSSSRATSRNPCCDLHPNRPWLSRRVNLPGYGKVFIFGTAHGKPGRADFTVTAMTDPDLYELIVSDRIRGVGASRHAGAADRIDWQLSRVRHALVAMVATAYYQRSDLFGGPDEMLNTLLDLYLIRDCSLHSMPCRGLDLTDPASY